MSASSPLVSVTNLVIAGSSRLWHFGALAADDSASLSG
jgi:hypothetical protein